jgi:multicomponent K+:H+ antiporter subunit E
MKRPAARPLQRLCRALLPAPLLALALWVAWLMLAGSASLGQMLLGAALALPLAAFAASLDPQRTHIGRVGTMLKLGIVVLRDIAVSNIDVARRVFGPESAIHSRWVALALTIQSPPGVAALASIITLTPGTLSAELSADGRTLLMHVLHVDDDAAEAGVLADIRARYEAPLILIFGR